MAELRLIVGSRGTYEDGDVREAFNDRRIGQVHMEHVCNLNNFGFTGDGLRPTGTLGELMYSTTKKFKFTRVSKDEILKTDLETLDEWLITNTPHSETGEYMHVDEFIRNRVRHGNHIIFGVLGAEVWYGGTTKVTQAELDTVWAAIQSETGKGRNHSDYKFYPFSPNESRTAISLQVDDFDDAKAANYVEPLYDDEVLNEETGEMEAPVLKKRKTNIEYWKLPEISGDSLAAIRDPKVAVFDYRDDSSFLCKDILVTKDKEIVKAALEPKVINPK